MSFSALDLYYLVKELQVLVNARISQIYHPAKHTIILEVYSSKTGKKYLWLNVADSAILSDNKESRETPTSLCMYLRKYLNQGIITEITQRDFDRILEIKIRHKDTYILIAEFFSHGNLVITDEYHTILNCLEHQEWKDRAIKPRETYKSPPSQINPLTLSKEKISEIISTSDKENIVKTLAISLSLGGEYAETILALANIGKNKKSLTAEEILEIYDTIQKIKENKPEKIIKPKQEAQSKAKEIQLKKLSDILSIQNSRIQELKLEIDDSKQKGDLIYANYQETEQALNLKKKSITLNNKTILLDSKKSLADNAASYYELSKKSKKKLFGAEFASLETIKKIKALEVQNALFQESQSSKTQIEKAQLRTPEWYEKFHWFFSSSNFLCIGGKDATSNEIIIKKHAEKNDIVFHTESPGSPFFIIKNPENEIIDNLTLEETAIATASYSQAWKDSASIADVYYTKPEQLSKAEGMQKGMFIINGKKTYIKAVLKLAIANVNNQIIAGPLTAIKTKSQNYLTIIQGDLTKNELAKKIKSKLGGNLEEIERMLPNGKSRLEK